MKKRIKAHKWIRVRKQKNKGQISFPDFGKFEIRFKIDDHPARILKVPELRFSGQKKVDIFIWTDKDTIIL